MSRGSRVAPWISIPLAVLVVTSLREEAPEMSLRVTATAYNSTPGQTAGDPRRTAWGDMLEPGMKAIAVSRDLIDLGLDHGTEVRIEGMDDLYIVRDKLAVRWRQRIDIYMGEDVAAAREFGRRQLTIHWRPRPAEER